MAVDLLVPSPDGRFRNRRLGGRSFDAAPGLMLALAADPISIDVNVTLLDRTVAHFVARVPPVEVAVVLKAYATRSRAAAKDLTDLYNLLIIARNHPRDVINGWSLDTAPLKGARRDAVQIMQLLADGSRHNPLLANSDVPRDAFTALIRSLTVHNDRLL